MKQVPIESVDQLLQAVNELPNNFLYRGQANADWPLQSSLERIVGSKWSSSEAQKFEDYSLKKFRSKFHLYDRENTQPESKLAWLSIMQHYGVPTRLLDFTESPYIALYFALEAYNPQSNCDLALYAIDYTAILESSIAHIKTKDSAFNETRVTVFERQDEIFDKVVDRFSYDIAWIAEPKLLNARLDRQAGSFLLSGNRGLRIEEVLGLKLYEKVSALKFIVPTHLYKNAFALLRKMNINSKSLYGDLDGLARAIKMEMQIYSV
ncbi:FRG domain-containing protein [Caldimonas tepidiphila]|uniref:FRG domain-containing protein n=1 Tax=Caldimonas tepidiphila TaxID=2315841 RepID=UPI000E5AD07F|nr:FRG domain-containing protein [Caldimonas tepidiphila]